MIIFSWPLIYAPTGLVRESWISIFCISIHTLESLIIHTEWSCTHTNLSVYVFVRVFVFCSAVLVEFTSCNLLNLHYLLGIKWQVQTLMLFASSKGLAYYHYSGYSLVRKDIKGYATAFQGYLGGLLSKSGTQWMSHIIQLILNKGQDDGEKLAIRCSLLKTSVCQ